MRINLEDGRLVVVDFKHDSGNNDPRIQAIKEQRNVLFNSHVFPDGTIEPEVGEWVIALDAAIGALRRTKKHTVTCEVTVLEAETIQATATYTVTWKHSFLADCRREALNKCLTKIWPLERFATTEEVSTVTHNTKAIPPGIRFDKMKNRYFMPYEYTRPFRKQVWTALIASGFRATKETQKEKFKRKLREAQGQPVEIPPRPSVAESTNDIPF